jgi:hypothetical protein
MSFEDFEKRCQAAGCPWCLSPLGAGDPDGKEWDCRDGTLEEDHDWRFVGGDEATGEGDYMECRQCGKTRDANTADLSRDPEGREGT